MTMNAIQIEEVFCAGGSKLPDNADVRLLVAQLKKPDAFKSEYLSRQENDASLLLKIRSLMFRGNLVEARAQLNEFNSKGDHALETEVKVEMARIDCYEGNWAQAIQITQEALTLSPSALNCLTLHQIRGTAFFAMGEFHCSLRELEFAKSFEPIFPDAQSGFYIRVLEARLQAQLRGPLAGRYALDKLWQLLNTAELNSDHLLSLLRAEIELRVVQKKSALEISMACFSVSKSLGDMLYTDLALVDCYAFADENVRKHLEKDINEACERFKRVKKEFIGLSPSKVIPKSLEPARFERGIRSAVIAIPRLGFVFYLNTSTTLTMKSNARLNLVVRAAAANEISKQIFFNQIWGNQQYSARLHDGVIRTTLSRLRKKLGIKCEIKNENVVFEDILVLNEI